MYVYMYVSMRELFNRMCRGTLSAGFRLLAIVCMFITVARVHVRIAVLIPKPEPPPPPFLPFPISFLGRMSSGSDRSTAA